MDRRRSHNSSRKGKEKMPAGVDHEPKNTIRGENWTAEETNNLINAIDQVQTRRGRKGFSFTKAKNTEIYAFFMKGIPDSKRDKVRVVNRVKVVKAMFKACDELAKRSGGGWDDATNRPIAPSEEEYEEMVRAKGEHGKFLLKTGFPWYRKMESMLGEQPAKGARTGAAWDKDEPIHYLMDSHMTIHVSSQGSSDEPDEDSVRSTDMRQNTHGSVPSSGTGGSKRKSTPESSEQTTRGKKYKERHLKKQSEVKALADVGLKLVNCMTADTKALTAPLDEESESLSKLKQLNLPPAARHYCLKMLAINKYMMKWFIQSDREEILDFVRSEMGCNPTDAVPRPSPSAFSGPNHGFPQPNPTASAFQPNPTASAFMLIYKFVGVLYLLLCTIIDSMFIRGYT